MCSGVRSRYTATEKGYEHQFALNHFAGFLLTHRLLPYLKKGGGRIILTGNTSHKHMKIHWQDIMYKRRYNCLLAYKQSMLCNMLFAKEFNHCFAQSGVRAYVVDPALVNTDIGNKQTGGIVDKFWSLRKRFGRSPEVAAQTYAFLGNSPSTPDGFYYRDSQKRGYSRRADDRQEAKRLFERSERLCCTNVVFRKVNKKEVMNMPLSLAFKALAYATRREILRILQIQINRRTGTVFAQMFCS